MDSEGRRFWGDRDILFMCSPHQVSEPHFFVQFQFYYVCSPTRRLGHWALRKAKLFLTRGEVVVGVARGRRQGLQCDETGIVASGGWSLTWQCGPEVVSFRYGQKREKGLERHHGRLTNRGTGLC
jgi:hypothetical protein